MSGALPDVPPYPERGVVPWDEKLKEYIDYRDSLGVEGPIGPPGVPGGDTVQSVWTWEVVPASPPMEHGTIGAADPPPRQATELVTSCHDIDDNNHAETLQALAAGDHIHLQVTVDPDSWHTYAVTGSAIDLGYDTYAVPVVTDSGSPPQTAPSQPIKVLTAFQFAARPGPPGPPGPIGPVGPPGGASYIHDQIPLSDVWVVTHNLGRYPSVTVVDSGGTVVFPDIHYDDSNEVTITFGSSTSGKVYLS